MLSSGLLHHLNDRFAKVHYILFCLMCFTPPAWLILLDFTVLKVLGDDVVSAYMYIYKSKFLFMGYSKLPDGSFIFPRNLLIVLRVSY